MLNKNLHIVVEIAELEAKKAGKKYLGSEHFLLGLLLHDSCMASKILKFQNITIEQVRDIISIKQSDEYEEVGTQLEFTPKVKYLIESATLFAQSLNYNTLGTEHFLAAILKDKTCFAHKVLLALNFNVEQAIDEIINLYTNNKNDSEIAESKSILEKYSKSFNKMVQDNKFDPIIGREDEIERIIQILARRNKNNPCLVGDPGVGKTAIIEGLAQKIVLNDVPNILKNKKIYNLDLTSMVAGSKYRGEFEDRIKKVIEEASNNASIILFIDEIHTIIGAGSTSDSPLDAANILKPYLSRGEIQIIGSTTVSEYRKYIEKDPALERRFQPVKISEPTEEEAIYILEGVKHKYEEYHGVKIEHDSIKSAVQLSKRYINDRFLPDKAFDLLDEACARVKLSSYDSPKEIRRIQSELSGLQVRKEKALKDENYEEALSIKNEEVQLRNQLQQFHQSNIAKHAKENLIVNSERIAEVVSKWTKVPVSKLTETENKKLLNIENILHQRVIGQNDAINAVAKAIRRSRVGLKDPTRPSGVFLFLGNSGVGKTELAKALAESLFGDEKALIRVDMSEYMESHSVSKLIGSPPGYVGHEEAGQLTEKIRQNPYSIVLLDEIEKAHNDVTNILLQVFDDGHLTDSHGKTVDFKNTIIIMTSNVGSKSISEKSKQVGFGSNAGTYNNIESKDKVNKALNDTFRPEFINRIDDIIIFNMLSLDEIKQITDLMIKNLNSRLQHVNVEIHLTDSVKEYFSTSGFDPKYGARPLRRLIQNEIENKISELILMEEINNGIVVVDYDGEKITYS